MAYRKFLKGKNCPKKFNKHCFELNNVLYTQNYLDPPLIFRGTWKFIKIKVNA